MATATYTCQFSSEQSLNQRPSASLTGPSVTIPDDAVVTNVKFSVYCGVSQYNQNVSCGVTLTDSNGDDTSISDSINTGSSNRIWVNISDEPHTNLAWGSLSSVTLSGTNLLTVRSSYEATLTIEYMTYSECSAPTSVTFDTQTAAPGARVTLSWSGAKAGENNPIVGYQIYRATDSSGSYTPVTSVSRTSTSGSTVVSAPTKNGDTYYFKVATLGQAGYDSEMSVAYAELTCTYAAVTAPSTVSLNVSNAAPDTTVVLSWSGATAGENNTIVGYEIYQASSADGTYSYYSKVSTSATSGSKQVRSPLSNGTSVYFKVKTLGSLSGYDSELSSNYAALTSTYSKPVAPSSVTLDGKATLYAPPGETVQLSWSGATAGVNNAIAGYTVYQDGKVYASNLAATANSCDVVSHSTPGETYSYTVVTLGVYKDIFGDQTASAHSKASVVYSYTDPTAPTSVTVSNDEPPAGGRILLSWSGAGAGGFNDITGYKVYRSLTESGALTQVASVSATEANGSCYVVVPPTKGATYYYWVETVGSYSQSGVSEVYVSVCAGEAASTDEPDTEVIVPAPKRRSKRGFLIGDYDTAANGWTLTGWSFPEPEPQTNYLTVPGRIKGPLDLSTALTDGDPRFGNRNLTVTLECSDGTRLERDEMIYDLANQLHGRLKEIVFPDDDSRYAVGRVKVQTEYSDVAHAAVTITAVCEPWRYNRQETRISLMAVESVSSTVLYNGGRCVIVPEVIVDGASASVILTSGDKSWTLAAGSYRLPDLALPKGNTFVSYRGYGNVVIRYREAII